MYEICQEIIIQELELELELNSPLSPRREKAPPWSLILCLFAKVYTVKKINLFCIWVQAFQPLLVKRKKRKIKIKKLPFQGITVSYRILPIYFISRINLIKFKLTHGRTFNLLICKFPAIHLITFYISKIGVLNTHRNCQFLIPQLINSTQSRIITTTFQFASPFSEIIQRLKFTQFNPVADTVLFSHFPY